MTSCDALLVKVPMPAAVPTLPVLAEALGDCAAGARLRLLPAQGSTLLHVVLEFADARPVTGAETSTIAAAVARGCALRDAAAHAARLTLAFERGALGPDAAPFHYMVETNTAEGWFDETVRWYDTEHMPGLAAVPGCLRARRYLNLDDGPRSVAAYDLTSPDVLTSPSWLAVRATAWSSRIRPHFRDTLRTMFRSMSVTLPARTAAGAAVQA
jgi:hypothetical protein